MHSLSPPRSPVSLCISKCFPLLSRCPPLTSQPPDLGTLAVGVCCRALVGTSRGVLLHNHPLKAAAAVAAVISFWSTTSAALLDCCAIGACRKVLRSSFRALVYPHERPASRCHPSHTRPCNDAYMPGEAPPVAEHQVAHRQGQGLDDSRVKHCGVDRNGHDAQLRLVHTCVNQTGNSRESVSGASTSAAFLSLPCTHRDR